MSQTRRVADVPLRTIAREWTRIGLTGFGGPPAHITLLRQLVSSRDWIEADEFERAITACNLLPGPASTQLAIYCANRLGGPAGAVVGGVGFILPAVVMVTALSALFLASAPPEWVRGAAAGAGSAVAAVAVHAGLALLRPSWTRAGSGRVRSDGGATGEQAVARAGRVDQRVRWVVYVVVGGAAGALLGPFLVLVLLACGAVELAVRTPLRGVASVAGLPLAVAGVGGLGALAWVAFKVGALSYGGGFVIVPLMRADAVHTYHWMTAAQFLSAVALGQVTPGPVVATIAAVGFAAHGVAGSALAALVAFLPSFTFVLVGARHFDRLSRDHRARAFLDGAGPAAIGAILGAAIPLAGALQETWQFALLGLAAVALLVVRRGVVGVLVAAGVIGAIIGIAGGPLP